MDGLYSEELFAVFVAEFIFGGQGLQNFLLTDIQGIGRIFQVKLGMKLDFTFGGKPKSRREGSAHHLSDVATVVRSHPHPKPDLQGIDARLLLEQVQHWLGLVGLRRTLVYPTDDTSEHFFLAKLH